MTDRIPSPSVRLPVAVRSDRHAQQGSGVLLTDDTVLTCAHVLRTAHSAWVSVPGRGESVLCQVIWSDQRLDAALLQAPESLLAMPGDIAPRDTYRAAIGRVATDRPVPDCEILGYPRVQRYAEGRKLESDQYRGTLLPLAGLIRHTMVVELDAPPATEPSDGSSPLAGLSGGPVVAGDGLLGIVREIPRGRGHRRVECVPMSAIAANADFLVAYTQATGRGFPSLTTLTRHSTADSPYEQEYAEAVEAAYRRTRIFGLDELGRRAASWDLDAAYLSLEATSRDPGSTPVPHRIDELLASRPRVLLRGDAGAGKTTLVWWLAAHAAGGTLGPQLAELNGLVPFVVPLRTLRARGSGFPPPAELPDVAGLMIDPAPDGWAGRVLSGGRGLLLVDGLDEVPQEDREAAHDWLSGLLARFPRTRCVATVRPLAVEPEWLATEGFEELTLLPMRDQDIQAFVTAWHDAAGLDGEDPEALEGLEQDLLQQFRHNPTLSDLARTPLLCAVICALHRLREGFLPETRWALYESALQMLLGARDDRRRIDAPDGIRMSVEEHQQLLQRLAAWLVRGGQTECTRDQALHQLNRALPGMPRVAGQGTPEEILTHLLNRSGLLQQRTDDVFQFAHRTFQDFLAAKEFVEDDLVPELLRHAREQQWHDVLLLAAGHCSRRELPVLVEGLLAAGSAGRKWDLKTTLYVLAALCAQHAAWLSEPLHHRVRNAVKSVLPPRSPEQVNQLARLGPYVLPLLPGPHEDGRFDEHVIEVICSVGGAEAVPYARGFVGSHVAHRLAFRWRFFPPAAYAREVLARLDLGTTPLLVSSRAELAQLSLLGPVAHLCFMGDFTGVELAQAVAGARTCHVEIVDNPTLDGMEWLRDCGATPTRLTLQDCTGVTGLVPLTELAGLEVIRLRDTPLRPDDVRALAGMPGLRVLSLQATQVDALDRLDLAALRAHPHLDLRTT
ncbi:NACHT domain-containing protein [Streptomyces sp. NBC_01353]|uniref:NACHT domain-containing protein n=1 Tax=Streptomyces sp. NBC_01353 TaxID=2903835 RepID=UPI002E31EA10|nr:NACHT domain-containing protein [Streptomyces sp. NBC_01353]